MLLGLDVGTTHTKLGLYDADGELRLQGKTETPRLFDRSLEHFDPDGVWLAAARMIRDALPKVGADVDAVSVASMGEAGVSIDAQGRPTHPIIPWYDGRSAPQMRQLAERVSPERLYAMTGLAPSPIHTVAKWAWLRQHAPEAWRRTRLWLPMCDYIGFRLTGEARVSTSQACRTMAYDVRTGGWSPAILEAAELDDQFLPSLATAGEPLGTIHREAAASTGLPTGTPVYVGGHDHICAAFACGAVEPEVALDSQGTAEGLTVGLAGAPDPERAGGFGTGPHVVAGHSYLMGGVYSSGGSLRWVKDLLGLHSFEALRELASSVPPGEAPLFVAQMRGAAPPFSDPDAKGAFVELEPEHGPAHLARAVFEGVAFELRAGIEALEQVSAGSTRLVRMVGGMASDPLWGDIRAAVLGRPLELARYADMVTLGAALLAGLGHGTYSSAESAVDCTYRPRRGFEPDPSWAEAYQPRFARYMRFASATKDKTKLGADASSAEQRRP